MLYKEALDLFGVKNVLDMDQPGLSGYNGIFNSQAGKLNTSGDAVDAVWQTLLKRYKKGNEIRLQRFEPNFLQKLQGVRGSFYTPKAKNIFGDVIKNKKGEPIPYVFLAQKQAHPGILAHQLGHADSKKLAFKSRLYNQWSPTAAIGLASTLRRIRKDRPAEEYDKRDAITDALIGGTLGLGSWKAGTNTIKSQLDASARGLRNLKASGVFSGRTINQSKQILRNALKSYKKERTISTAVTAAAPMTINYLGSLIAKWRKKKQEAAQAE